MKNKLLDINQGNTYAETMTSALQRTKWRLIPTVAIGSVVLAMTLMAACFLLYQRQQAIELAADQIYDVAMPTMSEATRMVRGLERLAHAGEALMWIEDKDQRELMRQSLHSIAMDGVLQGDPELRAAINEAFAMLDSNLATLTQKGNAARAECLAHWQPVAQKLLDYSERVGYAASMAASDDAERIILATRDSRDRLLHLMLALLGILMISLSAFFVLIVRPLIRLSRTLTTAQQGFYGASKEETFREFQALSDAADAMASGQRALIASKFELEQLAHTDVLTGLANRRQFIATAEGELSRHDRYGDAASLIMFDLDHFKQINDRYGHEGGDAVLRAIGTGLAGLVRRVDLLARIGGEEFAVLLPQQNFDVAIVTAERLRASVEAMVVENSVGAAIRFTASFGVAQHVRGESLEALMNRADVALYEAKATGRNRVMTAAEIGDSPAQPPDTTVPITNITGEI